MKTRRQSLGKVCRTPSEARWVSLMDAERRVEQALTKTLRLRGGTPLEAYWQGRLEAARAALVELQARVLDENGEIIRDENEQIGKPPRSRAERESLLDIPAVRRAADIPPLPETRKEPKP